MKRRTWKQKAREAWRKKKGDSCRGRHGEGDGGSGEQGGLHAKRHVNGERQASLFFLCSLCPVQLLLCVFCTAPLPALFFCFVFCGMLNWLKFFVLGGLKIRVAVLHGEIVHFIKYWRPRETGDGDL